MSDTFDKKELSGWDKLSQLREEYAVTKGRIIARVEELLKICDELK